MIFNLEPTISRIALFLPVNSEFVHVRKHLQRFLLRLDERIFKVLFKLVLHVLGKPSRIVVAIDWTQIGKRYLFMAAITIDGRTLPIAFLLRENKSVKDKSEMVSLIGRVINDPVEVTIVADGEFFSPKFLDCVKRRGFHYVIRIRKKILFNRIPLVKYSDSTKDLWFGKYSKAQSIDRLFGLLAIYSFSYVFIITRVRALFETKLSPGLPL